MSFFLSEICLLPKPEAAIHVLSEFRSIESCSVSRIPEQVDLHWGPWHVELSLGLHLLDVLNPSPLFERKYYYHSTRHHSP